jgi:hypothetical protein
VTITIDVATRNGLHRFDAGGTALGVELDGRDVSSLAPAGQERWAILDRREVWHDAGDGWTSVAALGDLHATRIIAVDDTVYVGTTEAHLLRVAGDDLERVQAFDTVDGRDGWYTPWGGPPDVRSIANWDDDVYVNVHVGGIPRTDDRGATWRPTIDVDADVHQVTTAEGLVIAACAGGVATSTDRGDTWTYRTDGLETRYSRGVAVCGDVLLASASRGPRGGDGAVYRGAVAVGGAFERCREGLPDAFDGNIDTYRLDALRLGTVAAFGTEDGRVFVSDDAGASWSLLAEVGSEVRRVLVLP